MCHSTPPLILSARLSIRARAASHRSRELADPCRAEGTGTALLGWHLPYPPRLLTSASAAGGRPDSHPPRWADGQAPPARWWPLDRGHPRSTAAREGGLASRVQFHFVFFSASSHLRCPPRLGRCWRADGPREDLCFLLITLTARHPLPLYLPAAAPPRLSNSTAAFRCDTSALTA